MTAPISETKIQVEEYSVLLQKALDANVDTTRLTEKYGEICLKDELDVIIQNVSKSWRAIQGDSCFCPCKDSES